MREELRLRAAILAVLALALGGMRAGAADPVLPLPGGRAGDRGEPQ
jgi:hypothetical protein